MVRATSKSSPQTGRIRARQGPYRPVRHVREGCVGERVPEDPTLSGILRAAGRRTGRAAIPPSVGLEEPREPAGMSALSSALPRGGESKN
jgi:hypothetical protein